MGFKRKASEPLKSYVKRYKRSYRRKQRKTRGRATGNFAKKVRTVVKRLAETKHGITNFTDGVEYAHMSLTSMDNDPFYTTQGVFDSEAAADGAKSATQRIGDMVQPTSLRYKMYLENNERFGEVHYKIWWVSQAGYAAAPPSIASFFRGMSDNKIIDEVNTDRFTVYKTWSFTIKNPQPGHNSNNGGQIDYSLAGSGTFGVLDGKDGNAYLPGHRYVTLNCKVPKTMKYHDQGYAPNKRTYHLVLMPYVLRNTSTTINVCIRNDMQRVFKFKDI